MPSTTNVAAELVGKNSAERCRIKADAFAVAFATLTLPHTFRWGAYDVTLETVERVGDLLHVVGYGERNGKRLPVDGDFWIRNPPIRVPKGAEFEENIPEALRQIIGDAVRVQLREKV